MKSIGVIGVGEIAKAMVIGLCNGRDDAPEVFLSPRGTVISSELAEQYETVQRCANNQEVVDSSDIVIIALRASDCHEALTGLTVAPTKILVNVIAGVTNAEVEDILSTKADMVHAIPLPSTSERRGLTVTWPAHPDVDSLFNQLGSALPVEDESVLSVMSVMASTASTYYAFLQTIMSWGTSHGVPAEDVERYVRWITQNASGALKDESRPLKDIARDFETPSGANEFIRKAWFTDANAEALLQTLESRFKL